MLPSKACIETMSVLTPSYVWHGQVRRRSSVTAPHAYEIDRDDLKHSPLMHHPRCLRSPIVPTYKTWEY